MENPINNLRDNSSNNFSFLSNCKELISEAGNSKNNSSLSKLYDYYDSDNSSFKINSSETKSIIKGTISSSLKDNILLNSIIYGMMYCPKCMIPCSIIFNDNFSISFECECSFIKNISIKEFINDYINKGKQNIIKEKYQMHCKRHLEQTKFIKYCIDCETDLCIKCLDDKYLLLTKKIVSDKKHDNHTFIYFEGIEKKFNYIDNLIQKYEDTIYYKMYNEDKNGKIQNVFQVIKCLMENFQEYKCYNLYKSIENAETFLKRINDDNFKFDDSKYTFINLLKITSEKRFDKKIEDFYQKIISIKIKQCDKSINLSSFENKKFINLKELTLVSNKCNNIYDISPLFSCEFPVLEIINLEDSGIDNAIIDLFEKKNFPELIYLNLYSNKITNIKLFEVITKFKKLKHFFVGENKFDIYNNPKDFYEFPDSIEEFGMTGNLEGDKCNFFKKLDISNLKVFYISRNNIDNLNYIENIKFKRLEKFYSMGNNITDIKEIMKIQGKENLKLIDLRGNKINNFHELINIVSSFPNLERFVVRKNEEINKALVNEIKNKIKEKYGLEFEIVI